jgi:hypothetical protein
MSAPVSAMITSAVVWPTPGMVARSSSWRAKGPICSSIRLDNSRIAAESWSMRCRCSRHKKAWCSPKFPVSAWTSWGILGRLLEDCLNVILVNAPHAKGLPGLKQRVGGRGEGADLLAAGALPTRAGTAHARLEVLLPDIQPSAPLMQQLHETPPQTTGTTPHAHPEGPQGQRVWSACSRQQSTVPVGGPSAILKHELKGITDTSASRTNAAPFSRLHSGPAQRVPSYWLLPHLRPGRRTANFR